MSELPTGWVDTKLDDLGVLYCGQSPSARDVNQDGRGTPYVTGPEQWDGQSVHRTKWTTDARRVVPDGCIFITVKGAGVGTMFPGIACAIGRDVYAYRPLPQVDFHYVSYSLQHTIDEVLRNARGDIPGLSRDHIVDHSIGVPPLEEQRRIVAKLDSLRARSTRARQELDHIPKLIERYKQAILAKAFSGELTADWRRTHGASDWKQGNAGPYFKWASGKFLPKSKQSPGQIPVYGGNGPNGFHDNALVAEPTLVVGRVGAHCGNVHLTSGPAWVTDNAIYASEIAPTVDAKFALLLFRNANLNANAGGSGQPFVNQTILNQTDFPLPDLAEQREIVRLVHVASTWLDKIATEHARAEHLLPKLDQAVLAKAFRGELVPQDPNDEPASELLERIKAEREGAPKPKSRRSRQAV